MTGAGAVFLDRDGTINEDFGYVGRPEDVVLIEGAAAALRRLNAAGVKVIIITNQSGAGRRYFSEEDIASVNRRVAELLSLEGARVDGIYYCPHRPEDACPCRKPETGLIERAAKEHGISPSLSYVVGDKLTDVLAAGKAGAKGVLVLTGKGRDEAQRLAGHPDITAHFVARDLPDAVEWIMRDLRGR